MRAIRVRPILAAAALPVMALLVATTPVAAQDYLATPDRVFHTPRRGVAPDVGRSSGVSRGKDPVVPAPVNVFEDCWTTNFDLDPDPEHEIYTFTTDDLITFIWKEKLLV